MTPAQMSLKLLTPSSRDNRDVADEMETSLWLSRWPCVEPQVSREGGGRTFVPGRGQAPGVGAQAERAFTRPGTLAVDFGLRDAVGINLC